MKNWCQAIQHSDQKVCDRCGHCWDMNDPEPPECLTENQIKLRKAKRKAFTREHMPEKT